MPVGDIGFHAQKTVFNLADGLVRRNRKNIDGEHHIAADLRKLSNEAVLDIAGVILQVEYAGITVTEFQVIRLDLNTVGADIVFEVVSVLCRVADIEGILVFIAAAVKVVQSTESFIGIHRNAFGAQRCIVRYQIRLHSGKIVPGLIDVFLADGDCHVLFLHDPVGVHSLVEDDSVVLIAVHIQTVRLGGHQDGILKIRLLHVVIVDRDLGTRSAVQTVQDL